MSFEVVPRERVAETWPNVAFGIATAMKGDEESTLEDVKEGLLAGRLTLLLMQSAPHYLGMVVSIVRFHRCSVLRVHYAFGRGIWKLRDAIADVETWAKAQGCNHMEGWVTTSSRERLFGRFGYSRKYAVIRKPL